MTIDTTPPVGLSVWERELFEHLVRHLHDENELIGEYDALAADAGGEVAYVLGLIVEDEQRHHRVVEEWCNALRADAEYRDIEPSVPRLGSATMTPELRAVVDRLVAAEQADKKDIHRLRKLVKDQRDLTLWGVLLDVMELDTDKHLTLLRFLQRHPHR